MRNQTLTEDQKVRKSQRAKDRRKNLSNEEKLRIYKRNREWLKNNPEKAKALIEKYRGKRREYSTKWQKENKKRASINHVNWVKNNPIVRFSSNIRNLVYQSFKGKKSKKTEEILGCSIPEFIEYILTLYPDKNITIDQFGRYGYHIDHITPISIAKTDDEVIKLCHYSNLQPLWWEDNIKKSNKT